MGKYSRNFFQADLTLAVTAESHSPSASNINNRIYLPFPAIPHYRYPKCRSLIGLSTLQHLQMNDWLALCRLPFTPLHRLWTIFSCNRCTRSNYCQLSSYIHHTAFLFHPIFHTTTSFFSVFIFKPLAANLDFHFTILSCRLSSLSVIKIKSHTVIPEANHFHYYQRQ